MLPESISSGRRYAQMLAGIRTGLPFLKKGAALKGNSLSIVGYGPSLLDTWKEIHGLIMATSGAYDFLVERGMTPDFYVAIDPLPRTVDLLKKPQENTEYLMATVLHPSFWEKLSGFNVMLWHCLGNDAMTDLQWIRQNDPKSRHCGIGGGSTVVQRAMAVAEWAFGIRSFDIYGMDCSYADGREGRHAGPHTGDPQPVIFARAGNREFRTTCQMAQSALEMKHLILHNPDACFRIHGDGLLQEMVRVIQQRKRIA